MKMDKLLKNNQKRKNLVKYICLNLNITQKQLAEKLCVSEGTINRLASNPDELKASARKTLELFFENEINKFNRHKLFLLLKSKLRVYLDELISFEIYEDNELQYNYACAVEFLFGLFVGGAFTYSSYKRYLNLFKKVRFHQKVNLSRNYKGLKIDL